MLSAINEQQLRLASSVLLTEAARPEECAGAAGVQYRMWER